MKRHQRAASFRTVGYGRDPQAFVKVAGVSMRRSVNVNMTPAAKAIVEKMAERLGMSETQLATRLIEWYAKQDDALRLGILGIWPQGSEAEIVRHALKRLGPQRKRGGK